MWATSLQRYIDGYNVMAGANRRAGNPESSPWGEYQRALSI